MIMNKNTVQKEVYEITTPIVDFVKKYADAELVRMHMPGHKGKSFLGYEGFDLSLIHI